LPNLIPKHALNIEIEKDEEKLIENYALTIVKKAINGEIEVEFAFKQMLKIVSASGYDPKYIVFYEIDEDLDYLKYDNSFIFNYGLTLENSKEFILEEFKIFDEMETLKIPIEEHKKCYCEKCKNLNIPITKNKYQLKKPFKYLIWSCGVCGSEKLKFNNNHEVKRMIIERFKKNYA
jgi:RNase P subunit RPR2